MKLFFVLIMVLACSTASSAQNVSVLTDIEKLQEKAWYLERDLNAQKSSIETQQKQLAGLKAGLELLQSGLNERLGTLAKADDAQKEVLRQLTEMINNLNEALAMQAKEAALRNSASLELGGQLKALAEAVGTLQLERSAQQNDADQALSEVRAQLAGVEAQLAETDARLAELDTEQGGRSRQLVYLGAGAALGLALALTVNLATRSRRRPSPGRGHRFDGE